MMIVSNPEPENTRQTTDTFLDAIFQQLKTYFEQSASGANQVVDFKLPDELEQVMDLSLSAQGAPEEDILQLTQQTLDLSVRCIHPHFYNQLFAGVDPYALAGDFIASLTNGSMYTYEVAPVYSLMERVLLQNLGSFAGWDEVDGIFAPGGSIANLYGLLLARHRQFPEIKEKGIYGAGVLVCFVSEHAHYSFSKAAHVMGLGTQNTVKIACDDQGRMLPDALEVAIQLAIDEGKAPFCVVSTLGTTVIGAIDPISEVADLCETYKLWHHVDASLGGSALMTDLLREKVQGVSRVDSLAWNPHKTFSVPQQCSAFLTRHQGLLADCNSMHAGYLFQQDKISYDVSLDTGDKSIQCGRHIDVLKLFLHWKGRGTEGLVADTETNLNNARKLADMMGEDEQFELLFQPQFIQTCFYFIPPSLVGEPRDEAFYQQLDKVAPVIKARMMECGSMMVGYQRLNEHVNFFRMVFANPATSEKDLQFVLDEIKRLGADL